MVIDGTIYMPWFKWKKRQEKRSPMTTYVPAYPVELHRLKKQSYLDEQEFARVKQMLDSPDRENQVIAEQILITLRKKRLKGLR